MKKIIKLKILILLTFSLILTSCNNKSEKYLKIALLGPFDKKEGRSMKNSAILAVNFINKNGGIKINQNGETITYRYKLHYVNDKYTNISYASVQLRKTLSEKNCDFIIGGFLSKLVVPLMDIMAEKKVIWLGTGGASSKIIEKINNNYDKYKYYFRIGSLDISLQGKSIASFCRDMLLNKGLKKVAFIGLNHAYSKYLFKVASKIMKADGFKFVYKKYINKKNKDLTAILNKAKKADFILCIVLSKDARRLIIQAAKLKINEKMPILGIIGASFSSDFYKETNGGAKWISSLQSHGGPVDRTGNGKVFDFIKTYKKEYKANPYWLSYSVYDSFFALKKAIERSNSINTVKLIKTFEANNFEYVGMTRYKWHKNHDLYYGMHNGKMYSFMAWFQFYPDGKRYCIYPLKFKQKQFHIR